MTISSSLTLHEIRPKAEILQTDNYLCPFEDPGVYIYIYLFILKKS